MSLDIFSFHNQESDDSRKNLVNSKLSLHQLDIIKLAADSMTNKEIGNHFHISEKTIKKTREKIYKVLNINGKEEVRLFLRWIKANM